eukprot:s2999_g12.t3
MSQVRTSGCASSSCSWSLLPCSPCAHGNSLLVLCFSYLVFWLSFEVFQCQGNATLPKCLSYLAMNRFMGSQARRFMSVRFLHLRLYRVCSTEVPEKFLQYGQAVGEKRHKQLSPLLSPQHAFSPCNLAFSALAKVKFPVHQGFRVVVQRIACGADHTFAIAGLQVAMAACGASSNELSIQTSVGFIVAIEALKPIAQESFQLLLLQPRAIPLHVQPYSRIIGACGGGRPVYRGTTKAGV